MLDSTGRDDSLAQVPQVLTLSLLFSEPVFSALDLRFGLESEFS